MYLGICFTIDEPAIQPPNPMTPHTFYPLHRARQLAREVRLCQAVLMCECVCVRALIGVRLAQSGTGRVAPYWPHQHRHPFSRCATCELGAWRTSRPILHSRCWRQNQCEPTENVGTISTSPISAWLGFYLSQRW